MKTEYLQQIAEAHGWPIVDIPMNELTCEEIYQLPIMARITDLDFNYTNSANTDVQATWKRHGWKKPNRSRQHLMAVQLNMWRV